jgi:hypothetical protein
MSLKQWENSGWLKAEPSSRNEIQNLFVIIERDLKDSRESVSVDWQFGIAYNAALKLCTILLRSEGYRTAGGNHHYRTIAAPTTWTAIWASALRGLCVDFLPFSLLHFTMQLAGESR